MRLKVRQVAKPLSKYGQSVPHHVLISMLSLCSLEPRDLTLNHMDVGYREDLSAHCCSGLRDLAQVRWRVYLFNAHVLAAGVVDS